MDRGRAPHPNDEGFTLVELLVVVIVLGVLATITVFAVRGIVDQGEESATAADERTLVTAEEAHQARFDSYASEVELVSAGLLSSVSSAHDITIEADGSAYTIVPAGSGTTISTVPSTPTVPTVPTPTVAVPVTFAGFSGESFGSGPNRIVVISDGSAMAPEWESFVGSGTPLATTEVIFLGEADVNTTAKVEAVIAAGSTYLVAARSVPISSPSGTTFVGQYLSTRSPSIDFWWGHERGGFDLMLEYYRAHVVEGG